MYIYQSAKQLYLILLNIIFLENRSQFLALKAFSDCSDSFYTGLMEQKKMLEVLWEILKLLFCFFPEAVGPEG